MPTPPTREDDAVLAELARAKTEALVQASPEVASHKHGVADATPPTPATDPQHTPAP